MKKVNINDFKPLFICTKIFSIFVKLLRIFKSRNFVKMGMFNRFTRDSRYIFGTASGEDLESGRTSAFANKLHHRCLTGFYKRLW